MYIMEVQKLMRKASADCCLCRKMNVTASLCDYSAQSDKDRLTEHMPDAADVQSRLNRKDVYYDQKAGLCLFRLQSKTAIT